VSVMESMYLVSVMESMYLVSVMESMYLVSVMESMYLVSVMESMYLVSVMESMYPVLTECELYCVGGFSSPSGRERLSGILGVSSEQASRFQDSFLQTYRQVQTFIQNTVQRCQQQGECPRAGMQAPSRHHHHHHHYLVMDRLQRNGEYPLNYQEAPYKTSKTSEHWIGRRPAPIGMDLDKQTGNVLEI